MRAVILGTDFVYDKNGNLKPIETNTNAGWEFATLEEENEKLDLSVFGDFFTSGSFTKLVYIGSNAPLKEAFQNFCLSGSIEFEPFTTSQGSITVPYIEDKPDTLIIRSAYDTTAIIDSEYCADKVNFLNLIKDTTFGSQFAYINESGSVINNITVIPDNGIHPNFIMKSIKPYYDKQVYPKLFRVETQSQLDIVLSNIKEMGRLSLDFLLMEFHLDQNNLYNNQIKVYRGLNMLYAPDLDSIPLGGYTTLSGLKLSTDNLYNPNTFELQNNRYAYLTDLSMIVSPKLLDTDEVEMADGTFKTPLQLAIGDYVKTISIPNPDNIDLVSDIGIFNISFEEFLSGSTYTTNKITNLKKIDKIVNYVNITFTDGTEWADTESSSYLVNRNGNLRFLFLGSEYGQIHTEYTLQIGDKIVLIDTNNDEINAVEKEVQSIVVEKKIFGGWIISVENRYIFLTRASGNTSFVAIEHNVGCIGQGNCNQGIHPCSKSEYCTTALNQPCEGKGCVCTNSCGPLEKS